MANFMPTFPQPAVVIGYLWKVEFALAALIFFTLILALKYTKDKKTSLKFKNQEIRWVIAPLFLFTTWSGISCFWAESPRNALHHTLLWACFCIFYLLVRHIVSQMRLLDASLKCTGLVCVILGLLCFVEYLSTSAENSVNISLRYSKYAEALATLLPIFVALTISKKSRSAFLFGIVTVSIWLGVILSLGRTQFLAGLSGILFVVIFSFLLTRDKIILKRLFVLCGILFLVTTFSQLSALSNNFQQTTLNRFSDQQSQASFQVRILFWEIALENFKENPLLGVGGDNFVTNYKTARENYSQSHLDNANNEFYEGLLPERTHNEYLQILSELGIVGIFFFGWLLFGISRIAVLIIRKSFSLLSIAAFAGIVAFLVSSIASSYSFRVPANGICFFFVLALAASRLRQKQRESEEERHFKFDFLKLKHIFVGLIICSAMLTFSAVRGVSLMYLQESLSSSEKNEAERSIQKAIALDRQEPLFRYYYGMQLLNWERSEEAIPQMRFAIDKGISTSISYFSLASAQIIAHKDNEAEQTFTEALRVYPRSAFLRTAYSSFLIENGKNLQGQNEYEKALQTNAKQAASWQIAHTQGMEKLTKKGKENNNLVEVMDLQPTEGVYALLDFQRQSKPNLVER